ncbi:MAG: hypothetical protein ACM3L5_00435, partial [Candidatus Saccharibacteria bacterium]
MSNNEMDEQTKRIKEDVSVDVFTWNIIMLLFLAVTVGYLVMTHGMFGEIDLSFALIAVIAAGIIVYAGSMVRLLMRGKLVRPIGEVVYILAPTAVLASVLAYGPSVFPSFLGSMTMPTIMLGAVMSADNIMKVRRGPAWLALRALALVVAGFLLQSLAAGVGMPDLGGAVLIGAVLAASLSLAALFREHSDPRWRSLGRAMARTSIFLIASALIIMAIVYVAYLRPLLMQSDSGAVMMIEWIVIGLSVLILALLARRSMREPAVNPKVDLENLLHGSLNVKGDQTKVVEAMTDFVAGGSKDRVLVLLISALRDSGLDDNEVLSVVGKLTNYHEDEVSLTWAWTYGDLAAKRRRERSRLMKETLEQAAIAVAKRPMRAG